VGPRAAGVRSTAVRSAEVRLADDRAAGRYDDDWDRRPAREPSRPVAVERPRETVSRLDREPVRGGARGDVAADGTLHCGGRARVGLSPSGLVADGLREPPEPKAAAEIAALLQSVAPGPLVRGVDRYDEVMKAASTQSVADRPTV